MKKGAAFSVRQDQQNDAQFFVSFLRKIPLPVGKIAILKGRWLNASARNGKTPGSNRGRRSETAICIYGLREERLYVNSWGRSKTKKARRVGAKAPARFYVWQKRILFLKLRKLRIPKQTRFKTFVLLLQPSINPFDQGTSMELRISLNQL